MGEHYCFFAFTNQLKKWAQNELRRRNVTTLVAAYEVADRLTDWHSQGGSSNVKGKEKRGPPNLTTNNAHAFKNAASNSQEGGSHPLNYGKDVAKLWTIDNNLSSTRWPCYLLIVSRMDLESKIPPIEMHACLHCAGITIWEFSWKVWN